MSDILLNKVLIISDLILGKWLQIKYVKLRVIISVKIYALLFKGIIQRGKLVLKTVIYIPPLFVSSQTKRAYYMLKKRLQIVCEDTNEGLRFSKLRMPCHRTLYSSHLTLWTGTYYTNIQNFVSSQNTSPAHKFNTTYFTCSEKFMCGARVKSSSDYTDENNLHGYSVCTY